MLNRRDFADLIPHQGAMSLLDQVQDWDEARLDARAVSHADPANPLRRPDGHLHAVTLCETAAQAMALHGALIARAQGRAAPPGWLVSLREVELGVEFVEALAGPLAIRVERLLATPGAWQYQFRVEHHGRTLVSGRAAVILR